MASRLALEIVSAVNKPAALASSIECAKRVDDKLQEAREVLDSLRREFKDGTNCFEWHRCRELERDDDHTEDCQRAQRLWPRLQVEKGGG